MQYMRGRRRIDPGSGSFFTDEKRGETTAEAPMSLCTPTPSVRTLKILTIRQGGTASGSPADAVRSKRKVPFSVQAQNESFSFSPYPALLIVFAMSSFTGRHPKDMAHNTLSEYWHSHTQDTDSFHKPRQKKLSVYCVSVKKYTLLFWYYTSYCYFLQFWRQQIDLPFLRRHITRHALRAAACEG